MDMQQVQRPTESHLCVRHTKVPCQALPQGNLIKHHRVCPLEQHAELGWSRRVAVLRLTSGFATALLSTFALPQGGSSTETLGSTDARQKEHDLSGATNRRLQLSSYQVEVVDANIASERLSTGWKYLDVRSKLQFVIGHPPEAVNVPLALPTSQDSSDNRQFVKEVEQYFEPGDKIIVGCKAGKYARAAAQLLTQDFSNLAVLGGGFDSWVSRNLQVEVSES